LFDKIPLTLPHRKGGIFVTFSINVRIIYHKHKTHTMAKDKKVEAEYKLEKLRRTKIRKKKRKGLAAIKKEQRKRFCPCCGYDHTGFY